MHQPLRHPRPTRRARGLILMAAVWLAAGSLALAANTIRPSEFAIGNGTLWQFVLDHSARSVNPVCYRSSVKPEESFTCLKAALTTSGLDATLKGNGPITLFAPTDAGFAELAHLMGSAAFVDLMTHADKLKTLLNNVMVEGHYTSRDLQARAVAATGRLSLTTLAGSELDITFNRFPVGGRVSVKVGHAAPGPAWQPYLIGTTTVLQNGTFLPMNMVFLPPSLR